MHIRYGIMIHLRTRFGAIPSPKRTPPKKEFHRAKRIRRKAFFRRRQKKERRNPFLVDFFSISTKMLVSGVRVSIYTPQSPCHLCWVALCSDRYCSTRVLIPLMFVLLYCFCRVPGVPAYVLGTFLEYNNSGPRSKLRRAAKTIPLSSAGYLLSSYGSIIALVQLAQQSAKKGDRNNANDY